MLLLGIDLETTGLDFSNDDIIEIGAVLWDSEIQSPVRLMNLLVRPTINITEKISKLTGISQKMLDEHGVSPIQAVSSLSKMMGTPNIKAVVAHNGNGFDKPMLESFAKRHQVSLPFVHWIDTLTDISFPEEVTTRKLSYLAAEYGFINPFSHRAVFDVLTMFEILKRFNIEEVLAISKEPMVKLEAITVPPWQDDGKSANEAKARGFRWEASTKQWVKNVKLSVSERELSIGGCRRA